MMMIHEKYGHIYHQGISLMGMKKPLLNPATADRTGDSRNAFCGKLTINKMSSAVQTWFKARFTNAICRNSIRFHRVMSISYRKRVNIHILNG